MISSMSQMSFVFVTVLVLIGVQIQATAEEMRVRDIPIAEGATDVSYMKRRGDVRFHVPTDFKTTGGFYAKKLSELNWTKSGKDNLQQNFWVQNSREISCRSKSVSTAGAKAAKCGLRLKG